MECETLDLVCDDAVAELWKKQVGPSSLPADVDHKAHTIELTRTEIRFMLPYLKSQRIAGVIDLGCGSGRVSVGLDRSIDQKPHYWLVDAAVDLPTKELTKHWRVYPEGAGFKPYNRREVTAHFCELNGLDRYDFVLLKERGDSIEWLYPTLAKEREAATKKADLLYAWWSVCFHFPIRPHLEMIGRALRPGAICFFVSQLETPETMPADFEILDVRRHPYELQSHWRCLVCRYVGPSGKAKTKESKS